MSESDYWNYVNGQIAKGWRIESQTDTQVALVKGQRPNHVLHLLLSVFTAGIWLPFWLIISWRGGEKRELARLS